MKFQNRERGFSLIEIMVGVAVLGILALFMANTLSRGFRGTKSARVRSDIPNLQRTILSRLNCAKTYQATSPATTTCTAGDTTTTFVLKDSSGQSISQLGDWSISATINCPSNFPTGPDSLIVTASRSGTDTFTNNSFNSIKTSAANNKTVSTDLFGGTGNICGGYLQSLNVTKTCPSSTSGGQETKTYSTRYDASGVPACDSAILKVQMTINPTVSLQNCSSAPYTTNSYSKCLSYIMTATCPSGMQVSSATMRCDLPFLFAAQNSQSPIYGFNNYSLGVGTNQWLGSCDEFYDPSQYTVSSMPDPLPPASSLDTYPAAYVNCVTPL